MVTADFFGGAPQTQVTPSPGGIPCGPYCEGHCSRPRPFHALLTFSASVAHLVD